MRRRLVFGLVVAALTAGCYKTECEISCADGFNTTVDDDCSDAVTAQLAQQHGGSCRGEEHKHL